MTQFIQKSKSNKQINNAPPEVVFPLLCPVREMDWVDGWDYKMIHSKSGLVEQDCVFSTPHHGAAETIWYVTVYDKDNFTVEFLRVTPSEEAVKINIELLDNGNNTTTSIITYQYTALNEQKMEWINNKLDDEFEKSMAWWEKAINYYIKTRSKAIEAISLTT